VRNYSKFISLQGDKRKMATKKEVAKEAPKSWTDRLTGWMEAMAPLFDQPHLASVRDGLASLMPFLIIGAFTLLAVQFPIQAWLDYLSGNEALNAKLWVPFNLTYGLLSPFAAIAIAYNLARRRGMEPLMPAIMSLLVFMVFATPAGMDGTYFDSKGLFTAIIVALLSVEIYRFFVERKLVITMPPQVPPSIANAFISLVPGIVLLLLAWIVRVLFDINFAQGVVDVISKIIPAASSYPAAAFAESVHAFLWTMGIHGDLTIGIVLQPIWVSNIAANAQAVAAGQTAPFIYSSEFRAAYVVPGGSGATFMLALYLIRSKVARLRKVGWLGIWPGIFNINEPITFGTPVIFNPVMAIPFIIITFLNVTFAWLMHTIGFVKPMFIAMPWTLPGPILAYLQAGYQWQAAVVNICTQFIIPGVIWYPAFKAWERMVIEKEGTGE
jgi:PTS system cellobiose-specific IIC component